MNRYVYGIPLEAQYNRKIKHIFSAPIPPISSTLTQTHIHTDSLSSTILYRRNWKIIPFILYNRTASSVEQLRVHIISMIHFDATPNVILVSSWRIWLPATATTTMKINLKLWNRFEVDKCRFKVRICVWVVRIPYIFSFFPSTGANLF